MSFSVVWKNNLRSDAEVGAILRILTANRDVRESFLYHISLWRTPLTATASVEFHTHFKEEILVSERPLLRPPRCEQRQVTNSPYRQKEPRLGPLNHILTFRETETKDRHRSNGLIVQFSSYSQSPALSRSPCPSQSSHPPEC